MKKLSLIKPFDITEYLSNSGCQNDALFAFYFGDAFPSSHTFGSKFRGKMQEIDEFLYKRYELTNKDLEDFKTKHLTFIDKINKLLITHGEWNTQIYYSLNDKKSILAADKLIEELVKRNLILDERAKVGDSAINILVKDEEYGLRYNEIKIPTRRTDISTHYSDDLKPKFDASIEFLKSDKQGIILYRGDMGCGKTSLIKELVAQLSGIIQFVYIPPNYLGAISDAGFLTFLASQKTEKNTVFIIEDAETALKSRDLDESVTSSVSNLLNMADGFLGDILKIKFICTMNICSKVDKALLRKGRLMVDHEFKALPPEKANVLLQKLNKKERTNIPMTLAEIYHSDSENFHIEEKQKSIGFKIN